MKLTETTALLDYKHPSLQQLIAENGWADLSTFDRIGAAYIFVRDEIKFGYNRTDALRASEVLRDGIGQCNTKGTLLMALLRALDVPCRARGLTIHKNLQRGVMPEFIFPIVPENIVHSWVEISYEGRWINLEGYILDSDYLGQLQECFGKSNSKLCGYGVGVTDVNNPRVDWVGTDTHIQKTGVNQDFGVFASPDLFYDAHQQDFTWLKAQFYGKLLRHWMNLRVRKIRAGHRPVKLPTLGFQADAPDSLQV